MKNTLKFLTLIVFILITGCDGDDAIVKPEKNQSTEDFEDETSGTTEFTDNEQIFNITSNSSAGDTFRIGSFNDGGWNGSSVDQLFIEILGIRSDDDGTSFIVSTADGAYISVEKLYVFIATKGDLLNTTNSTLTIEGKKDGETMYTITRDSNFSDVETFSPNNGFTFIDFSTEGGVDNSDTEVNEVVFTTTNDGDYVALDAFTWSSTAALLTGDVVEN